MSKILLDYQLAEKNALKVVKRTVKNCSAYKKVLKEKGFIVEKRKTIKDFPILDKANYINRFSLVERVKKTKKLSSYYQFCTSSGSTGVPTIWPRDKRVDDSLEPLHTKLLDEHFQIKKKSSLIVVLFDLGTSTAGVMHARLSWQANKYGNISTITPGLDIKKACFLLSQLHFHYEQIIIIGYPPLISDLVNYSKKQKCSLERYNAGIVFAGGGASGHWRKQMAKSFNIKLNRIISFYGFSESGMVGYETRDINRLLQYCIKYPKLNIELFDSFLLPTVIETDFNKRFFEIENDEIIVTVDQPIPLVRYNIHDKGKLIPVKEINQQLRQFGFKPCFNDKNRYLLVVYGREGKIFTPEEIAYILEKTSLNIKLDQEFQYKINQQNKTFILNLVVFRKELQLVSKSEKDKFIKEIGLLISKSKPDLKFKVKADIQAHTKKQGYKSGKLCYFFN